LTLREQWLHMKKVMGTLEESSLRNKQTLAQHQQLLSSCSREMRSQTSMSASPVFSKLLDDADTTSNDDLSFREFLRTSSSTRRIFNSLLPTDSSDRKAFSEEEGPSKGSSSYRRTHSITTRSKNLSNSPGKTKAKRVLKAAEYSSTESSGGPMVSSSEGGREEEDRPTVRFNRNTKSEEVQQQKERNMVRLCEFL